MNVWLRRIILIAILSPSLLYSRTEQVVLRSNARWAGDSWTYIDVYFVKQSGVITSAAKNEIIGWFNSTWGKWGKISFREGVSAAGANVNGVTVHLDPPPRINIPTAIANNEGGYCTNEITKTSGNTILQAEVYCPAYWEDDAQTRRLYYGDNSIDVRRALAYEVFVHEFGHTIGFGHEFLYFDVKKEAVPDNLKGCVDAAKLEAGETSEVLSNGQKKSDFYMSLGVYDPSSIMNYYYSRCSGGSATSRGDYRLSIGDIAGVRYLYGSNPLTAQILADVTIDALRDGKVTVDFDAARKAHPTDNFDDIGVFYPENGRVISPMVQSPPNYGTGRAGDRCEDICPSCWCFSQTGNANCYDYQSCEAFAKKIWAIERTTNGKVFCDQKTKSCRIMLDYAKPTPPAICAITQTPDCINLNGYTDGTVAAIYTNWDAPKVRKKYSPVAKATLFSIDLHSGYFSSAIPTNSKLASISFYSTSDQSKDVFRTWIAAKKIKNPYYTAPASISSSELSTSSAIRKFVKNVTLADVNAPLEISIPWSQTSGLSDEERQYIVYTFGDGTIYPMSVSKDASEIFDDGCTGPWYSCGGMNDLRDTYERTKIVVPTSIKPKTVSSSILQVLLLQ